MSLPLFKNMTDNPEHIQEIHHMFRMEEEFKQYLVRPMVLLIVITKRKNMVAFAAGQS